MSRIAKFTISLPLEEYARLEAMRKRSGLSRSGAILEALRSWGEAKAKEKKIRAYLDGYLKIPESASRGEAWEKASAGAFSGEDW